MDPVRNPYAPGAGQRPPELAGRGRELDAFDVVLERVARGRPERSLVLTGLRGVGKTVLLNTLRSAAIGRLYVRSDRGEVVELRNLVDIETGAAPSAITRSNRQRSVTLSGNLVDKTLGQAIADTRCAIFRS